MKKIKAIVFVLSALMILLLNGNKAEASDGGSNVKPVKAGFFYSENYQEIDSDGNKSGYYYELIEKMSRFTNWNISYEGNNLTKDQTLHKVITGELDFALGYEIDPYYEDKLLYSKYFIENTDKGITYVITGVDNKDLMDEINESLKLLFTYEPNTIYELNEKYFVSQEDAAFSFKEKLYIENNKDKEYTALIRDYYEPLIVNDEERNGILIDYLNLISEKSGLNIVPVIVRNSDEYYDAIYNQSVNMVFDALTDYEKARAYDFRLTIPYLNIEMCKVSLKNEFAISGKQGIIVDDFSNYYSHGIENKENLVYYESVDKAMDALYRNEVDELFVCRYLADRMLNEDVTNRLLITPLSKNSINLCVGVFNTNDVILNTILDKTIFSLTDSEKEQIEINNTAYRLKEINLLGIIYNYPVYTTIFISFISVLLLLFVFFLLRNIYHKKNLETSEATVNFLRNSFYNNDYVLEIDITSPERKVNVLEIEKDRKSKIDKVIKKDALQKYVSIIRNTHNDDRTVLSDFLSDKNIERLIKENKSQSIEIRNLGNNDKTYKYYQLTMQGMQAKEGKRKCCVLYVKNIDDIKKEEEEKRRTLSLALETSKHYSDVKSEFLAQMSHDLRTPMNAIYGMSSIAQMKIDDKEKVSECLQEIDKASDEMMTIIGQILDMTFIERGNFSFEYEEYDIISCLNNAVNKYKDEIKKKRLKLTVDHSTIKNRMVMGDKHKETQIFSNIISNAVKYTQKGGEIEVTLKQGATPQRNKHYYDFIVKDNGIGMDDATLRSIFNPFERGKDVKHTVGTGIGMSIVKAIVDASNGVIKVTSTPGQGTQVFVSMCIPDVDYGGMTVNSEDFEGKNIAIISSDKDVLQKINELCESLQMKMFVFENKTELLNERRKYIENPPEFMLIFINTTSNISTDIETVRDIRNDCGTIPIIIDVTNYNYDNLKARAKENGIDIFVPSSFYKDNLISSICDAKKKRDNGRISRLSNTGSGRRVLVVEDVEINRVFTTTIVEMKGFSVDSAENGYEAYNILINSPDDYYDIVLMDIQMPVMNGYEATRKIRASEREYLEKIPIIAMSANAFPEDIIKSKEAGMNDHLSKPIDIKKFSRVLDSYVRVKSN